jgi:hypothetical protein
VGQTQAAAQALTSLAHVPAPQAIEAGQIALALGCVQSRLGQADEARRQFDAGAHALAAALPPEHPLTGRAAQLQGAADCRSVL